MPEGSAGSVCRCGSRKAPSVGAPHFHHWTAPQRLHVCAPRSPTLNAPRCRQHCPQSLHVCPCKSSAYAANTPTPNAIATTLRVPPNNDVEGWILYCALVFVLAMIMLLAVMLVLVIMQVVTVLATGVLAVSFLVREARMRRLESRLPVNFTGPLPVQNPVTKCNCQGTGGSPDNQMLGTLSQNTPFVRRNASVVCG